MSFQRKTREAHERKREPFERFSGEYPLVMEGGQNLQRLAMHKDRQARRTGQIPEAKADRFLALIGHQRIWLRDAPGMLGQKLL